MQQGGLVKALFESFMTNPFRKLLTLVIKFFHRIDVRCQELRRHTHPTAELNYFQNQNINSLCPQNSNLSIAGQIMGLCEISDIPRFPNW